MLDIRNSVTAAGRTEIAQSPYLLIQAIKVRADNIIDRLKYIESSEREPGFKSKDIINLNQIATKIVSYSGTPSYRRIEVLPEELDAAKKAYSEINYEEDSKEEQKDTSFFYCVDEREIELAARQRGKKCQIAAVESKEEPKKVGIYIVDCNPSNLLVEGSVGEALTPTFVKFFLDEQNITEDRRVAAECTCENDHIKKAYAALCSLYDIFVELRKELFRNKTRWLKEYLVCERLGETYDAKKKFVLPCFSMPEPCELSRLDAEASNYFLALKVWADGTLERLHTQQANKVVVAIQERMKHIADSQFLEIGGIDAFITLGITMAKQRCEKAVQNRVNVLAKHLDSKCSEEAKRQASKEISAEDIKKRRLKEINEAIVKDIVLSEISELKKIPDEISSLKREEENALQELADAKNDSEKSIAMAKLENNKKSRDVVAKKTKDLELKSNHPILKESFATLGNLIELHNSFKQAEKAIKTFSFPYPSVPEVQSQFSGNFTLLVEDRLKCLEKMNVWANGSIRYLRMQECANFIATVEAQADDQLTRLSEKVNEEKDLNSFNQCMLVEYKLNKENSEKPKDELIKELLSSTLYSGLKEKAGKMFGRMKSEFIKSTSGSSELPCMAALSINNIVRMNYIETRFVLSRLYDELKKELEKPTLMHLTHPEFFSSFELLTQAQAPIAQSSEAKMHAEQTLKQLCELKKWACDKLTCLDKYRARYKKTLADKELQQIAYNEIKDQLLPHCKRRIDGVGKFKIIFQEKKGVSWALKNVILVASKSKEYCPLGLLGFFKKKLIGRTSSTQKLYKTISSLDRFGLNDVDIYNLRKAIAEFKAEEARNERDFKKGLSNGFQQS